MKQMNIRTGLLVSILMILLTTGSVLIPDVNVTDLDTKNEPSEEDAEIVLNCYADSQRIGSVIRDLAKEFNQLHAGEIYVKLSLEQPEKQSENYLEDFAANFDCFAIEAGSKSSMEASGGVVVLSLNEYFLEEGNAFRYDFDSDLLRAMTWDDNIYALPLVSQPPLLVYNINLMEEMKYSLPQSDWTLDEFLSSLQEVSSVEHGKYGLIQSGVVNWFGLMMDEMHIPYLDLSSEIPKPDYSYAELHEFVEMYADLYTDGSIFNNKTENPEDWWMNIQNLIEDESAVYLSSPAGEQATFWNGLWYPLGVEVLPFPQYSDVMMHERAFFISNETLYPDASWEWIKFVSDHSNLFVDVPVRYSMAISEEWESNLLYDQAETVRKAAQQYIVSTPIDFDMLSQPYMGYLSEAALMVADGIDMDEAIQAAQDKADTYYACLLQNYDPEKDVSRAWSIYVDCAEQVDPPENH